MIKSGELYSYKEKAKELIDYYIDCDQKNPAFLEILKALKTETFLVEDSYVDRDYLVDYSNFYAAPSNGYKKQI